MSISNRISVSYMGDKTELLNNYKLFTSEDKYQSYKWFYTYTIHPFCNGLIFRNLEHDYPNNTFVLLMNELLNASHDFTVCSISGNTKEWLKL